MYEQVEKSKENRSRAVAQKNNVVKQGFGFVDNRPQAIAQQKLVENRYNDKQMKCELRFGSTGNTNTRATIQRQRIGGIDVYVDKGYPVWESTNFSWHLTMKDSKRWHITKADRSDSYWFEMDGGFQGGVNPKKAEYGNHKNKHHNLSEAPDNQFAFIRDYIFEIMSVTEQKP